MSIRVDGLDELLETTLSLGDIGKKLEVSSFKRALKPSVEIIKRYAPEDSGDGKKYIKASKIKKYESGSIWGQMGINSNNWEKTKGIYFQHYGYDNWGLGGIFNGMHIDEHAGWFDDAYDAITDVTLNNLEKEVTKAVDAILK